METRYGNIKSTSKNFFQPKSVKCTNSIAKSIYTNLYFTI